MTDIDDVIFSSVKFCTPRGESKRLQIYISFTTTLKNIFY